MRVIDIIITKNEFGDSRGHCSLYCMAMALGRDRFGLIEGWLEIIGGP